MAWTGGVSEVGGGTSEVAGPTQFHARRCVLDLNRRQMNCLLSKVTSLWPGHAIERNGDLLENIGARALRQMAFMPGEKREQS